MGRKKPIGLALLGLGTVGQGVYDILDKKRAEFERHLGCAVEIKKILETDVSRKRDVSPPSSLFTSKIEDIVNDPEIDVVIELIGGLHPAKEFALAALQAGKSLVTANKALLALEGDEIFALAAERKSGLLFEASVAGGIPLIGAIRDGLSANRVCAFYGIINGTTNYILTEMAKRGSGFADVLKEAQALGYAERDPTADVEGLDAANKLILLMRLCYGKNISIRELFVEGITKIDALDMKFAEHFGYAIRLLATSKRDEQGKIEARVQPTFIPKNSILAKVEGAYNAVYIEGDSVGDLMFYGAGAGRYPTASAVVADVLSIARRLAAGEMAYSPPYGFKSDERGLIAPDHLTPSGERRGAYYLRFGVRDEAHVLETLTKVLAAEGVSIASLFQPPSHTLKSASIAILTHDIRESALDKALAAIAALPFLTEPSKRLPIEPLKAE